MSKEKISASVDGDVYEFLQQDHVNASGLLNKLAKAHISGEEADLIRQFRIEQVKAEIDGLEAQLERKQQHLEQLETARQSEVNERQEQIDEAVETLKEHRYYPSAQSPQFLHAVEAQAEKIGIETDELLEELPLDEDQ